MWKPVLVLVHADELAMKLAYHCHPEKWAVVRENIRQRVWWHLKNDWKVYFTQYRNPNLPDYLQTWSDEIITVPFPAFFSSQPSCKKDETHLEHQNRELEERIRSDIPPSVIEFWGGLKYACLSTTVRYFIRSDGALPKYAVPASNPVIKRVKEVLHLVNENFACFENPIRRPGLACVMNHEISF